MTRAWKAWLFAACVAASVVQGWILLTAHSSGKWLLYLGIVGAIPMFLLTGAHGGTEGASGVIGGILYVLTNGAVYYGLFRLFWLLKQWLKQKRNVRGLAK